MSLPKSYITYILPWFFIIGVCVYANASEDLFNALDTDQNGSISKVEANAHSALSVIFDEIDSNLDGEITFDEFNAAGLND